MKWNGWKLSAIVIGITIWGIALFMLFGCGGPMLFARDGGTEEQLAADAYDCDQQWEHSAGGIAFRQDPIGNAYFGLKARADKEACMLQKGWMRMK